MSHGHGHGAPPSQSNAEETKPVGWVIFRRSLPYLWPKHDHWLRFCLVGSVIFLVIGSLGDLYVPIALKHAIDELTGSAEQGIEPVLPIGWILVYGMVRFGSNFFQQLRDAFFASVGAETERSVALETFNHLQSLSLSFHLRRETGAVLRSVSRGAQSFSTLARIVLFQILPIFVQLAIVCIYLLMQYEWYFGVVTGAIIIVYMLFTYHTTNWRDRYRRTMNTADNEFNQKAVDALLNFETVKFFNSEQHEMKRYDSALRVYTSANIRVQQSLALLNSGQNIIISTGIVVAMYLSARQVIGGEQSVGDFVLMLSFILQLYQPLGFLGTFWRMIKQNIVDVESMFKLLNEQRDISDAPDARELQLTQAKIEFKNVSFAYDSSVPILKNVSFTVAPGSKVAIVGSSGAGKSTIARLLYRFYDAQSGEISIDGQDIRKVSQHSLRQAIGIVPQDTVLFNDTIGYNIAYGAAGRSDPATPVEIVEACKKASLAPFVRSQPEHFNTKVGERGLRLSGGEKQRVSIARAILKRPRIMIFDESTSALDSTTEIEIQRELDLISKGRSSITIAHRLSTIANSDLILVLDKGQIVEQGKHDELLELNGMYARMWQRQQKAKELQADLAALTKEDQSEKKHLATLPPVKEDVESDAFTLSAAQSAEAANPETTTTVHIEEDTHENMSDSLTSSDATVELAEFDEEKGQMQTKKSKKKKKGQGDLSETLL